MTVFTDISDALDTQLSGMAALPPVAWENKSYKPIDGVLYLRPSTLFGDTVQASLGASGMDENMGVYQVDVFAMAGNGKAIANTMADNVATRFARGTSLVYNTRTVRIISARRQAARIADGWYMIPVEIVYKSFTTPRV